MIETPTKNVQTSAQVEIDAIFNGYVSKVRKEGKIDIDQLEAAQFKAWAVANNITDINQLGGTLYDIKTHKTLKFKCSFCGTMLEFGFNSASEILNMRMCPNCKRNSLTPDIGIPGLLDRQMRIVPSVMADYLLRNYNFMSIVEEDNLYYFAGKCYNDRGREFIQSKCAEMADFACSTHLINEVVNHVKNRCQASRKLLKTAISQEANSVYLNLENGVFELESKTLLPHSPKYNFTKILPFEYIKEAKYNEYLGYLLSMMYEPESKLFDLPTLFNLIEAGANVFVPTLVLGKAALLIGKGGEGKGTWLKIQRHFIGLENCASVTVQELSSDKFAGSQLYLKMANFATEGKASRVDDSSIFKAATTSDAFLSIQFKGKDRMDIEPTAKMYISTNEVPKSDDVSDGFYDRWLPIEFRRRFRDTAQEDKRIDERMTTKASLSGIFNLYLEILPYLLNNQRYTFAPSLEDTARIYTTKSSSIQAWQRECVVNTTTNLEGLDLVDNVVFDLENQTPLPDAVKIEYIPKEDVIKHYYEFCTARGLKPEAERLFWIAMQGLAYVDESRPTIDRRRIACYSGIRLKAVKPYVKPTPLTFQEIERLYPNYPLLPIIKQKLGML